MFWGARVVIVVKMYTVESMGLYRLPTGMGSYDVGISYNTPFKEHMLSLHDNNEKKTLFQNQFVLKQRGKVPV